MLVSKMSQVLCMVYSSYFPLFFQIQHHHKIIKVILKLIWGKCYLFCVNISRSARESSFTEVFHCLRQKCWSGDGKCSSLSLRNTPEKTLCFLSSVMSSTCLIYRRTQSSACFIQRSIPTLQMNLFHKSKGKLCLNRFIICCFMQKQITIRLIIRIFFFLTGCPQ